MHELLPHWSIGKLINYIINRDSLRVLMAGRSLRDSDFGWDSGLQRYLDTQILSLGVSTYSTDAASYRKQISKQNKSSQSAFSF